MEQLVRLISRGRQPSVSTAGGPRLIHLALLSALALGCKPADEPQRLDPDTPSKEAPTGASVEAPTGELGTIRLVAPTGPQGTAPTAEPGGKSDGQAPADGESATPAVEAEASPAPTGMPAETIARAASLGVTEDLRAQIAQPPTDAQRAAAVEANRRGLKHHRKLDLEAAVEAYEAGLAEWAGHVFSRYNLACARSLQGDSKQALLHLAALSVTPSDTARARLKAARTDPDFQTLFGDVSFRALTGFAPVEVSWSPSVGDDAAAVTLTDALRRAEIPAHEGREWRQDLPVTTLYVAIGDQVAQGVADEIEAASTLPFKRVDSRFLSAARPIVLVLGTGDRAATSAVGTATSIDELLDVPMVANHEGIQEELQLKRTGFFSWTVGHPDGKRLTRTGRYTLQKETVHLDFRLTTETPDTPPKVTVEQGRRETHALRIEAGDLLVGSVRFKRAP